ncbi:type III-B CRISPR module RAMP protein Cmr6 [Larkinella sp. VNQ87]|uniref:type III-B CRISPR module RAMP protein Cmr6 n=1 Tax=Larkinella sp. VNQ87 TaxID=3400921 RepID=UPI003C01AFA8
MKNLGWYFYRNYYDFQELDRRQEDEFRQQRLKNPRIDRTKTDGDAQTTFYQQQNNELTRVVFSAEAASLLRQPHAEQRFQLMTVYPGLVTGSGVAHQTKALGEFKLGFSFDHTTGQPLLPGSTIKGALRAAFPNRLRQLAFSEKTLRIKELNLKKAASLEKYLIERIKDITQGHMLNPAELFRLEWAIFEGILLPEEISVPTSKAGFDQLPHKEISTYESDGFHDAFVVEVKSKDKKLLGSDFITPHKHTDRRLRHLDPFRDPTPIQFLKVLPKVVFEFQFELRNSVILSPEEKRRLFRLILLDFGIGAKTNVGYGQLATLPNDSEPAYPTPVTQLKETQPKRTIEPYKGKIKLGAELDAEYLEPVPNTKTRHRCKVWLATGGSEVKEVSVECIYASPLKPGQTVRIQVREGKDNINLAAIVKIY